MKKEVWFKCGGKSLGKASTKKEARDLGWKFLPVDIKQQYNSKDDLIVLEFPDIFRI
jgi:hypothetical protein